MRTLALIISLIIAGYVKAQDKLFFSDGSTQSGIIVSIAKEAIFFKLTDTSVVLKIGKSKLVMAEDQRGVRYLFASAHPEGDSAAKRWNCKRNLLGLQPLNVFTGRVTCVYEHFTKNDRMGWVIPLSLTFDPLGTLYNTKLDTNRNAPKRVGGVNFITGADLNFYLGQRDRAKFFIGPRFRLGTDLFLRGTEAYSLQTQFGWRFGTCQKKIVQHLSMGFGFARILASPFGRLISSRESYPWLSLNYRLGIRW